MRWFRLYDEVLDDPKVQQLSPPLFKIWINLLCLASRHGGAFPSIQHVAFALRLSESETEIAFHELKERGLIDVSRSGRKPHGWEKRQYKSDTSTERVKRFRKRSETVTVTPPEAETEADTERKIIPPLSPPSKRGTRGTRLASDWKPSSELNQDQFELARFRDYWIAQPGQKGVKTDWDATWRNWLRKAGKPVQTSYNFPEVPAMPYKRLIEPVEEEISSEERERRRKQVDELLKGIF